VVFLVRGVCGCGWEAALPEGARWPVCPECGEQVMPPVPAKTLGVDFSGREGYVAIRMPEGEALEAILETLRRGAQTTMGRLP
jgi:rRNA maturation protein Nop10